MLTLKWILEQTKLQVVCTSTFTYAALPFMLCYRINSSVNESLVFCVAGCFSALATGLDNFILIYILIIFPLVYVFNNLKPSLKKIEFLEIQIHRGCICFDVRKKFVFLGVLSDLKSLVKLKKRKIKRKKEKKNVGVWVRSKILCIKK